MKAIVCTKYGSSDVLQLKEVEKPIPKKHEILIKIQGTTVASGDIRVRSFNSPALLWLPMRFVLGLTKPRKPILGVELAGIVEDTGKNVTRFKKGDRVYALTGMRFGAYAEYTCMPENGLVAEMPANASFEEASTLAFGGTSALFFLRKAAIEPGQNVLIYGASGSVGTAAVQISKHFGANVTAVSSVENRELVKSLGADSYMDYKGEDFLFSKETYDVVFDAVGKLSKTTSKKFLTPNGKFLTVDGQGIAKVKTEDLIFLKELFEKEKIKAVIDRRYALEEIPEAHIYVEKGHKKGNVVITL